MPRRHKIIYLVEDFLSLSFTSICVRSISNLSSSRSVFHHETLISFLYLSHLWMNPHEVLTCLWRQKSKTSTLMLSRFERLALFVLPFWYTYIFLRFSSLFDAKFLVIDSYYLLPTYTNTTSFIFLCAGGYFFRRTSSYLSKVEERGKVFVSYSFRSRKISFRSTLFSNDVI